MWNISRQEFCDLWLSEDSELDVLDKIVENKLFETAHYLVYYCTASFDVTILLKCTLNSTPTKVNWFKPYHIGRCLSIDGFDDIDDLRNFISEVIREIKIKYCL